MGNLKDPIINVPLKETKGIVEVKIKEEIQHVSVKVAMAQLGGQPQLDLQMSVVKALKENGANTVGIRFEELPAEVVEKYTGKEKEKPKTIEGYCHRIIQWSLLQLLLVKGSRKINYSRKLSSSISKRR